jgi:hypothetical protein
MDMLKDNTLFIKSVWSLNELINLTSVVIGFTGTMKLAVSAFKLRAKAILQLTSPYARIAYAPEQIDNIIDTKVSTISATIVVSFAFLTQILSEFIVIEEIKVSICIVLAVFCCAIFISLLIDKAAYAFLFKSNKKKVVKQLIQDTFNQRLTEKCDNIDWELIGKIALDMKFSTNFSDESNDAYIFRTLKICGIQLENYKHITEKYSLKDRG